MAETTDIALRLDLRGLKCPLPVMWTERAVSKLKSNDLISVETTDPLAAVDIPHFCNTGRHKLVSTEKTETGHKFLIRKNAGRPVMRLEDFTDADIAAIENVKFPPEAAASNDEREG